jgi:hypothetical protein
MSGKWIQEHAEQLQIKAGHWGFIIDRELGLSGETVKKSRERSEKI